MSLPVHLNTPWVARGTVTAAWLAQLVELKSSRIRTINRGPAGDVKEPMQLSKRVGDIVPGVGVYLSSDD